MIAREKCLAGRRYSQSISDTDSQPSASGKTKDLDHLREPCCDTGPGFNEGSEARGFDFPGAGGGVTETFAHLEYQANLPPSTWQVGKVPQVLALHPRSRRAGRWQRSALMWP
jgi:hypothetical protein